MKPMSARVIAVGSDRSSVEKGFRWVASLVEGWTGSVMICGSEESNPACRKWRRVIGKRRQCPSADHRRSQSVMAPSAIPVAQGLSGCLVQATDIYPRRLKHSTNPGSYCWRIADNWLLLWKKFDPPPRCSSSCRRRQRGSSGGSFGWRPFRNNSRFYGTL